MIKQEKGITLVALVITIIILIILAAVTIASVRGDSNLLDNAQLARCTNAYGTVQDEEGLAFSALRSEITVQTALSSVYDATDNSTDVANTDKLLTILKDDLNSDNYYFWIDQTDEGVASKIYVVYRNTSLQSALISDEDKTTTDTYCKPLYDEFVFSCITLSKQGATFSFDISADGLTYSDFANAKGDLLSTIITASKPLQSALSSSAE